MKMKIGNNNNKLVKKKKNNTTTKNILSTIIKSLLKLQKYILTLTKVCPLDF